MLLVSQSYLVFACWHLGIQYSAFSIHVLRKRKREESVRYWMGVNLYYCYTDDNFWFEMVVLLRRLILAIALSLLSFHSSVRITLIAIILLVSLMIQFRYLLFQIAQIIDINPTKRKQKMFMKKCA